MKILSQGKFRDFDSISYMGDKEIFEVGIENTTSIRCTGDHKFLTNLGWVEAADLNHTHYFNGRPLISLSNTGKKEKVYDVIEVADTNSYTVGGVELHNCSFLYIDETAFVEHWDDFFASVLPTIISGNTTKMLLTSTPNGLNHFYKTCAGAMEGTNGYIYFEVPWQRVPGRDDAWKEETLKAMNYDHQKFSQEFSCQFEGSSGTLISGNVLKSLVVKPAITETNNISMYKAPVPGNTYVCIADVSRGKGLDYSAFQIIDVSKMPYEQVCVFRDNMVTPVDYAEIIYRTTKGYNDAYTLVEINDIGEQVSTILSYDFDVETLLFTESAGRAGKRISGGFSKGADKGIRTTKTVKAIGCNILKLLIEQNQLIINDFNTINELSRFSRKANSYEAESGSHDDLVMCLVLFAWLSDQMFFKEITDINTMWKLREKTEDQIDSDMLPFGFMDDGTDLETRAVIDLVEDNWLRF